MTTTIFDLPNGNKLRVERSDTSISYFADAKPLIELDTTDPEIVLPLDNPPTEIQALTWILDFFQLTFSSYEQVYGKPQMGIWLAGEINTAIDAGNIERMRQLLVRSIEVYTKLVKELTANDPAAKIINFPTNADQNPDERPTTVMPPTADPRMIEWYKSVGFKVVVQTDPPIDQLPSDEEYRQLEAKALQLCQGNRDAARQLIQITMQLVDTPDFQSLSGTLDDMINAPDDDFEPPEYELPDWLKD